MQEEEKKIALYENFKTINSIDPAYYEQYDVKRGLRNADGTGVVAGLTNIANVHGYVVSDNEKIADEGHLRYRGYDVYDLLGDQSAEHRFNFEEVSYLLSCRRASSSTASSRSSTASASCRTGSPRP